MDKIYRKEEIIDYLAEKCKFTKSDVKVILDGLETLAEEVIVNRDSLIWRGMFRIKIIHIPKREGVNPRDNTRHEWPECDKIRISISSRLKDIIRPPDKRKNMNKMKNLQEKREYLQLKMQTLLDESEEE